MADSIVTCPKCHVPLEAAPNFCPSCGEDLRGLTPTSDTLSGPWAGKLLDGRYRLLEKLGEGGMGSVFKVEHVRMGKVLALKLLRPEVALDKKLKARFHQEARVVSKLSHPNTIQVFDFGELEDGSLYIAMEFLAGRDLSWMLRAHGPFSEEKAIAIGVQVLSSLAEAHEHQIIHRDIKPANVMLVKRKDHEDQVKVLDFGIAKLNESESRKFITGVADLIGTPAYMSPEQANGEPLDPRSDLYSVAAMLFELVSGRSVFVGPTPMSIVTQHMTAPPPRFAEVAPDRPISPAFEHAIRKALAKDRAQRFADAGEMASALERARRDLGGLGNDFTPMPEEISSRLASREDFDRFERALRRRRVIAPLTLLAVVLGLGVGGWQLYARSDRQATRTAELEPNDVPNQATRIAPGAPVHGRIGPASGGGPDRDVYLVEVPPGPLRIAVSGIEDLNLGVEVAEVLSEPDAGYRLTRRLFLDDVGVGEPERVDNYAPVSRQLYLRVEEAPHFTEGPRPPREKSGVDYQLSVSPAASGAVELEPNDTYGSAPLLPLARPVLAHTGASLPFPPPRVEQVRPSAPYFSSVDFLLAEVDGARSFAALVVPPPGGTLVVVDASVFATWDEKTSAAAAAGGRVPPPPNGRRVSEAPELIPLQPGPRGLGVRVQPDRGTRPGAPYHVAFLSDGPSGLAAAIELARVIGEQGRGELRLIVLRRALGAFPGSPQAGEIEALLRSPVAAEAR